MLKGVPKREYPKRFYSIVRDFFLEVLTRKTSLKLYLAVQFPSLYQPNFKEGEILTLNGLKFKVPPHYKLEFGDAAYILNGKYSIPECSISQGDIVFDVGAHFGIFSYYAITQGASEVHAFEPNPYAFEVLKKNAKLWSDKTKLHQLALSDRNGEADLFITSNKFDPGTTILTHREGTVLEKKNYTKKVKVTTITLDDFVDKYNINRVDFIKIDAEGAERAILRGGKKTIREFKPKLAISAYHHPEDKERISKLVLSFRDDYKFKLVNHGEEILFFY